MNTNYHLATKFELATNFQFPKSIDFSFDKSAYISTINYSQKDVMSHSTPPGSMDGLQRNYLLNSERDHLSEEVSFRCFELSNSENTSLMMPSSILGLQPNDAYAQSHIEKALLNRLCARFTTLTQLSKNWDGYGASPLPCQAVERAHDLLLSIPPQSDPKILAYCNINPSPNGKVVLEWFVNRHSIRIFVPSSGNLIMSVKLKTQNKRHRFNLNCNDSHVFRENLPKSALPNAADYETNNLIDLFENYVFKGR